MEQNWGFYKHILNIFNMIGFKHLTEHLIL